jgi:oligopeptide transport system substrate-binding protein
VSSRSRFVGLGLVLACVGACSVTQEEGDYFGTQDRFGKDPHTFFVNAGSEPEYIDPGKAHDSISSKMINHLFEGLAGYGPDAEPTPAVALRYDRSSDNLYFRFHLRDDAFWSDGKPVTARDFEYAWRRVLDPTTASQASPNLYFLRNGELYNQGKLLRAKGSTPVFDGPDQRTESARLAEGDLVVVLGRSPIALSTRVAPLPSLPEGLTGFGYDAPNPKKKTPESMTLLFERESRKVPPAEVGPEGAWEGGDYDVLGVRGSTVCNGAKDLVFEVASADRSRRGLLPGCMLKPSDSKRATSLIARYDALPTFDARTRRAPGEPVPLGFVEEGTLARDPSTLGVRAVDERTLEVEAEYPVPYVLDLLCAATTFPVREDVVEPFKARGEPDLWTRPETFIGNGPYAIDTWRFRYEVRMKRNPRHRYHDQLKIHAIVWMAVESLVSTMNLYKAGELDAIGDNSTVPPPYIPVLRSKKDFETSPWIGTYWYELNTKVPPLDKVEVRRALNLAIDKQQLVDKITRAGQQPATHFVPPFLGQGYSDLVSELQAQGRDPFASPDLTFDPKRARAWLGEAGFPVVERDGRFVAEGMPPIELLYNTSEGHRAIAVTVQDMWQKHLGVSVQLRNEEWGVMLKNVRDKNFQVVRFGWIGDFDHPQTFLDTFMAKSPNNRTGWSSAKYDGLIQRARATADARESMKLYREAEAVLVDEVPKIPLYFYTKTTLVKPYVKGFHFNRRNEQLIHWMWLDPDWEKNPGASPGGDEPAIPVPTFPPPGTY